ncbi:uncharacterized protein [Temnothorax nylanderi]|uniref:uncharacterized protein n=1 Tax=Temnothorax nylanderi TaxID=102681 RepID=UPI003A88EC12
MKCKLLQLKNINSINLIKTALESNKVKKRCTYVNEEQKNLLVEFMRKHPELQSGKFSATFNYKHAQKLWEKVTAELHKIPGAQKEWKQWRKTWQDMRSSTKAKNASIKNHAKGTGGGPASSQVLTETDQNVLALMGSTVVEGHKTVQESNVKFEWITGVDDSIIFEIDDSEDGENFPIKDKSQEITQCSEPQQSLSSQNYHCSKFEDNNSPKESLNNNNDNYSDNNNKSLTKITTALETPINIVNNASHIPVTPISKSITIKGGVKRSAASQSCYNKSIKQTEKLANISQIDSTIRKSYYKKKNFIRRS